jgi:hypothetical protein
LRNGIDTVQHLTNKCCPPANLVHIVHQRFFSLAHGLFFLTNALSWRKVGSSIHPWLGFMHAMVFKQIFSLSYRKIIVRALACCIGWLHFGMALGLVVSRIIGHGVSSWRLYITQHGFKVAMIIALTSPGCLPDRGGWVF